MKAFIYQLISPSNKSYIGSTKTTLEKRISIHLSYLKNNKHPNKILQAAFNKYGDLGVIILEQFDYSINKEVIDKEQYYLDLFKPEYNICKKAYTPDMSTETRNKIKNSLTGIKFTKERKDNIKLGRTGIKPVLSLENRKSISERVKLTSSKPIIAKNFKTNDIIEFCSISEAEKTLKIKGISMFLIKRKYMVGDYVFIYKEEDLKKLDELCIKALSFKRGGYKGMGNINLNVIDLENNELKFNGYQSCADYFKCSISTIVLAIKTNKLFKKKYIITKSI